GEPHSLLRLPQKHTHTHTPAMANPELNPFELVNLHVFGVPPRRRGGGGGLRPLPLERAHPLAFITVDGQNFWPHDFVGYSLSGRVAVGVHPTTRQPIQAILPIRLVGYSIHYDSFDSITTFPVEMGGQLVDVQMWVFVDWVDLRNANQRAEQVDRE